ncbi:hypothetical protein J7384_18870 [Endozoicomonas sp. G2_1]|uniref:hypothetical protein n=1 Tax=Endozoicomonas sp. G2_1 TaxID=2821091 RepID=UPI001ADAE3EA|nr:hypothetical protein [Endozoicomonas sp. G2_1]MBO9492432.1 hypothetical protein [Endozoicomonas sp. G2_1]
MKYIFLFVLFISGCSLNSNNQNTHSFYCEYYDKKSPKFFIQIRGNSAYVGESLLGIENYNFVVLKDNDDGVIISLPQINKGIELEGHIQNDVNVFTYVLDKRLSIFSSSYSSTYEPSEGSRFGKCKPLESEL